jgi:flagellar motor switch protein FliN/FliY
VELFINDRPIAKGEVVIIDENFGVRLTSIVTTSERIRTLR